jgi:hypothetical protein
VKNKANTAVVCRTLHDVIVECNRLLGIAQAKYNKLNEAQQRAKNKALKGKKRSKKKQVSKPVKMISAAESQKLLKELYTSSGRTLPKYVNQHGGSWSAHVTFCRSLDPLAVDAIGVTAGARPWDFIANMVEVWRKVPASVQDALDQPEHTVVDGQESLKDELIDQDHMDKFMVEDKLYSVWNRTRSKLTVSPLCVAV